MFEDLKKKTQTRFAQLVASGSLFQTEIDRDEIWKLYLAAIPETFRQSNTCNCCKSFLRQFGGIVGISPDNRMMTLWDFEMDSDDLEYCQAVKALRRYVASRPIEGPFVNSFAKCGTDKNFDGVRKVMWTHFCINLPDAFVKAEKDIGPFVGTKRAIKDVLLRSINELTLDSVDTVLELIDQGSLYRGNEFKTMVSRFGVIQKYARKIPGDIRENYCWRQVCGPNDGSVLGIRNTAIGALLVDLSEGKALDEAVKAYERITAPANYKRPVALVTPRMVEDAKTRLQEMGLMESLQRRMLTDRDLTAANALHVFRRKGPAEKDVWDQMKTDSPINPRSLAKVEEVGIEAFVEKILPTAKSVKALLENRHVGNLVTLVGPVDPQAPTLFKWANGFSWSYAGEVADSIKERVKAAGGNVQGFLRISLSWNNTDDLDLHLIEPSGHKIYYPNKRQLSPAGGMLDLDANGSDGMRDDPSENIIYLHEPKDDGVFKVIVNQYHKRESSNEGFELEIECDGQVYSFTGAENGPSGRNHSVVEFSYTKKDGFSIGTSGAASKYPSKEAWGLKTGLFHPVKAITLSPNHWATAVGNKHFFFMLEGAKNDGRVRPFYNEFLKQDLDKDRKVFEILGSKVNVEPAEGELSGIGFSETMRNDLFVEVEGAFKRLLKIKF